MVFFTNNNNSHYDKLTPSVKGEKSIPTPFHLSPFFFSSLFLVPVSKTRRNFLFFSPLSEKEVSVCWTRKRGF
jgi:hypothetical protein